ncbi:MAG: peptidoglycan DD-metalloendopeptidase family protein [Deferribacteraceae bacterium]|jgi:septal ring factor EnvC (AmiA/AmiB activator)|nr:peptidoglycan DD-metalloendopeptidase family protein [Deferribacteraceae bacterium]
MGYFRLFYPLIAAFFFAPYIFAADLPQLKREIEAAELEIKKLSTRTDLAKIITLTESKLAKEKEALALINREIAANLKSVDVLRKAIEESVQKQKKNSEKARLLTAFLADNTQNLASRAFLAGEVGESIKKAELIEHLNLSILKTVREYEEQEKALADKSNELLQKNELLLKQRKEAEAAKSDYSKDLADLKARFASLKSNETASREYRLELDKRNQRLAEIPKATGGSAGAFAKLKGKLSYPMKGRVIERYGARVHPDTGLSITQYGIKIRPTGRGDIFSVAAGKVVYVNNLNGWQNIIIIEHDKNYFTVYGHVDEFYVKLNEEVKSGALIAGLDASIAEAYLYFEIRNHRDAVDPLAWFAK